MRTTLRGKLTLLFMAFSLVLAMPAVALADNVVNDVTAGGNDTINQGGSTTINYRINDTNNDGKSGCNAADGSPATLTISAPSDVSASKSTLTFTQCKVNQSVTFSSNKAGNYPINVTVSDSGVGSYNNSANFTLHVKDVTAPQLSLPADQSVEATGPNGVAVDYDASATDDVDGSVPVNCQPASGSTFPVGETTVNCSASDSAGNTANGSFKVTVSPQPGDTTAPETTIDSGPTGTVTDRSARFTFSSSEANSTFECSIDGKAFVACDSPHAYASLAVGDHTFQVRATDQAGNTDPSPASRTWTVNIACTIKGTSSADALTGTSGDDVICGGGGGDTIRGMGGNDILKGEGGNDKLLGGPGDDQLDGATGNDVATYKESLTAVTASLLDNSATGEGSDTFNSIESLEGSALADTLTGSAANDVLRGLAGVDALSGGDGNDKLSGGGGRDNLTGGGGDDSLAGEASNDSLDSRDGVNGNDSLDGGTGTDTAQTDATEKSILNIP